MAIRDGHPELGQTEVILPAVADAIRRILRAADGADEVAERLVPVLTAEREAIEDCLAGLVEQRLTDSFRASRHAGNQPVDPATARANCRTIAGEVLKEDSYFVKLARWVAVNVCFWLWEGDPSEAINSASVGSLIQVYTAGSAQAVAEMLSPPHKPIAQLEEILGVTKAPCGPLVIGEIPQDTLLVLSASHFVNLREALSKNTFGRAEGVPWPTAPLGDGGRQSFAQLRPPVIDHDPWLPEPQIEAWAQHMWRQQNELSDKDADALDALCAIYLAQARSPADSAVADVDQILALRGLKPKRGGAGRRGGYEVEQREEVLRALSHIQNLWINIAEADDEDEDEDGGEPGEEARPVTKTLQSRPFLITDRLGRTRLDGTMEVESFIFRPGKAFAAFLFGSGRHLLFRKALEYDPYRKKWEKRLTRYLSWHWGTAAAEGGLTRSHRVADLLEAVGERPNDRYPAKTRARLHKAFDTLLADGIIAGWRYAGPESAQRDWLDEWLAAEVEIEAPRMLADYYENQRAAQPRLLEPPEDAFARRLRDRRRQLGLSQIEAAQHLGIRQSHLSKVENGRALPSAKLRQAIEAWLKG